MFPVMMNVFDISDKVYRFKLTHLGRNGSNIIQYIVKYYIKLMYAFIGR